MAEHKRHLPSRHKLKEARKRGEIAYSRELSAAAGFVCALVATWAMPWRPHLDALMTLAVAPGKAPGGVAWLLSRCTDMAGHALWLGGPGLVAGAAGALLMAMVQARGVMSGDPLKFRFEKLNPAEGLQRIFSVRQLIEVLKLVLKTVALLGVLWWVLSAGLAPLLKGIHAPLSEVGQAMLGVLKVLFGAVAVLFLAFGLVDFGHQYHEHIKQNRMTDVERQREFRDLEGDPRVRAELKAQRRALLQSPAQPGLGLAGASVLLTNPTHYAVALFYAAGVVELPVLVAKGADADARALRREAQRLGIPIMENPPLTRWLFREVGLRQYIGEDHIEPVAEIFRWLQGLKMARPA